MVSIELEYFNGDLYLCAFSLTIGLELEIECGFALKNQNKFSTPFL